MASAAPPSSGSRRFSNDDELLDYLDEQRGTRILKLSQCDLSHLPPAFTGYVLNLERLGIDHNRLVDLPATFGQLSHLRYLNIRSNLLTRIPSVLLSMGSIEILEMGKNRITKLPAGSLGSLMNLKVLGLSKNRIKRLPQYIADMNNLRILNIDGNPLEYPPSDIAQMPQKLQPQQTPRTPLLTPGTQGRHRRKEDELEDPDWMSNLKEYLKLNPDPNADQSMANDDEDEAEYMSRTILPPVLAEPPPPRASRNKSLIDEFANHPQLATHRDRLLSLSNHQHTNQTTASNDIGVIPKRREIQAVQSDGNDSSSHELSRVDQHQQRRIVSGGGYISQDSTSSAAQLRGRNGGGFTSGRDGKTGSGPDGSIGTVSCLIVCDEYFSEAKPVSTVNYPSATVEQLNWIDAGRGLLQAAVLVYKTMRQPYLINIICNSGNNSGSNNSLDSKTTQRVAVSFERLLTSTESALTRFIYALELFDCGCNKLSNNDVNGSNTELQHKQRNELASASKGCVSTVGMVLALLQLQISNISPGCDIRVIRQLLLSLQSAGVEARFASQSLAPLLAATKHYSQPTAPASMASPENTHATLRAVSDGTGRPHRLRLISESMGNLAQQQQQQQQQQQLSGQPKQMASTTLRRDSPALMLNVSLASMASVPRAPVTAVPHQMQHKDSASSLARIAASTSASHSFTTDRRDTNDSQDTCIVCAERAASLAQQFVALYSSDSNRSKSPVNSDASSKFTSLLDTLTSSTRKLVSSIPLVQNQSQHQQQPPSIPSTPLTPFGTTMANRPPFARRPSQMQLGLGGIGSLAHGTPLTAAVTLPSATAATSSSSASIPPSAVAAFTDSAKRFAQSVVAVSLAVRDLRSQLVLDRDTIGTLHQLTQAVRDLTKRLPQTQAPISRVQASPSFRPQVK